jgi:hypothetical protein
LADERTITPVIGRAPSTADHVSNALGPQFLVVIGPRADVHLVDRRRAQQGFSTGDKGKDDPERQDLGAQEPAKRFPGWNVEALRKRGRQLDERDRKREGEGEHGSHNNAQQRAGQQPQLLRLELVPQHDGQDRDHASHSGQMVHRAIDRKDLHHRFGHGRNVGEAARARRIIQHHVELRRKDQHADPGQHPVDDRRRNGPEPLAKLHHPGQHLQGARDQPDHAQHDEAMFVDQLEHENGHARRRPAHLQRRTGQAADHQASDNACNQPQCRGRTRCNGNAHAQGQGNKEHDDRGQKIPANHG